MPREVPEWVGKTPDSKIPKAVKLRIWQREKGTCWLTGQKIRAGDKFDWDHKVALINGGEHRESNIAPALRWAHKDKTARDVAERTKVNNVLAKHIGIRSPSRLPPANPARRATTPLREDKRLPPPRIYQEYDQ